VDDTDEAALTRQVIGAAIEVHRHLGPGLLESIYDECLASELRDRNIRFARQVGIPIVYKGRQLDGSYQIDFIVEDAVVLEIKAVTKILPVHEAQLLTYMKLSGLRLGLLLNFNAAVLKDGICRRRL